MSDIEEIDDLSDSNLPAVPDSAAPASAKQPKFQLSAAEAEAADAKDKESAFGDISSFLKKHRPLPPVKGRADAVDDRYLIKLDEEVPEFSNDIAQAYVAIDDNLRDRPLYAAILPKDLPYRLKNIDVLKGFDHPNLIQLVAAGNAQYSEDEKCKLTLVYERPPKRTLRDVMRETSHTFSDKFLIHEIIAPINSVLMTFQEQGISHGRLNIDSVYWKDHVLLGECCTEPCGYAQSYHFESVERAQAAGLGKGETSIGTDCYALGVLVLHMMFGAKHFEKLDELTYMTKRLTLGSYNVLVGAKDSRGLEDFLKGVLNDDAAERWTPNQVDQWVRGKKFNLLTPSVLREGQRPFNFFDVDYFNRRALAHAIYLHWEESKTLLRSTALSRWVEVSLHKENMAGALLNVFEKTGGTNGTSEKANNELVARTICILDPEGPVRFNNISTFVDGLGCVLAEAFRQKDQQGMQSVIEILDYNFFNFVNEMVDDARSKRHANLLWKLQHCGRYLRMQAMGFGIERILYELNPNLPCQSPLLADENVLTVEELLQALDRMGTKKSKGFEYLDRHIAAFLATRMELVKEVKLPELKVIPALAQNPQLIVLHLLSQAQKRTGRPKLRGLSSWASLRILPLIDNFHSRTLRRKLRSGLKSAARSGDLEKALELIMDGRTLAEDHHGFNNAVRDFTRNAKRIARASSRKRRREKALNLGMTLAQVVSFTTLLVVIISTVKKYIDQI